MDAKVIHVAKFGQIAGFLTAAVLVVLPASAGANTTTTAPAPKSKSKSNSSANVLAKSKLPPVITLARQRLSSDIDRISRAPHLRRGKTAVYIVDAKSGEQLYGVHEHEGMNPASNVKLVATATALDVLGPKWTYQTSVYGPTPDQDGVVKGDLYLYGDHDGSLTPSAVEGLAQRVAASGIKRIEGNVLFGSGNRDAIAWPWTYINIQGGATVNDPPIVSVYPKCDLVRVIVQAKTSWHRNAWAFTKRPRVVVDPDGRKRIEITVVGAIRVRRKQQLKRWIPMRSRYTASVLRTALMEWGVDVTGQAEQMSFEKYVRGSVLDHDFLPVELSSHTSAPLSQLVSKINKYSDNILADKVTMAIGRKMFGGSARLDKGTKAMSQWLSKHTTEDTTPVVLDTGSGLSYKTRISARQIVGTLRSAAGYDDTKPSKHTELFRKSLSVAGKDGTLRRRFRGTTVRGKLQGKTGTLSSVIALSGFLHGPNDRVLAFSIVTNGTRRHLRWGVRLNHDKIVHAMHRYLGSGSHVLAARSR